MTIASYLRLLRMSQSRTRRVRGRPGAVAGVQSVQAALPPLAWQPALGGTTGANLEWQHFSNRAWLAGNKAHLNGLPAVRWTYPFNGDSGISGSLSIGIPEVQVNSVRRGGTTTHIAFDHQTTGVSPGFPPGSTVYLSRTGGDDTAISYGGFTIDPKQPYTVANASNLATTIDMGATVTNEGTVALSGVRLFQSSFERSPGVPRAQHANIINRVDELLADGVAFFWGGPHQFNTSVRDLWALVVRYGFTAVQDYMTSEWQWIAARNWPADRVAVAICGPELIQWTSPLVNGVAPFQWVRDWVLPTARSILPAHTLVINHGGDFGGINAFLASTPEQLAGAIDPNMLVEIHSYPGLGTGEDWKDEDDFARVFPQITAKCAALGIRGWVLGEFGMSISQGTAAERVLAYNRARDYAAAAGAMAFAWGAKTDYVPSSVQAGQDGDIRSIGGYGPNPTWSPNTPAGFWGPLYEVEGIFGLPTPAPTITLVQPAAGTYVEGEPITVAGTLTGGLGDIEWRLVTGAGAVVLDWALLDVPTNNTFSETVLPAVGASLKIQVRRAGTPAVTDESAVFEVVAAAPPEPPPDGQAEFVVGGGIAGAWAHLDASDSSTVRNLAGNPVLPAPSHAGTADPVQTWQDKSGNARHFTHSPTSGFDRRPVSHDRVAGYGHGLLFGGPRSTWNSFQPREVGMTSAATLAMGGTANFTIFMVVTPRQRNWTGTGSSGAILGRGTSTGRLLTIGHSATVTDANHAVHPYGNTALQALETGISDDNWARTRIYTIRQTGANARVYLDGVQVGEDFAHGLTAVTESLTIGNQGQYGGFVGHGFNGWVHEVIVFASSLSDGNMTTVHNYLAARWPVLGLRQAMAVGAMGQSNMAFRLEATSNRSLQNQFAENARLHIGATAIQVVGFTNVTAWGGYALTRSAGDGAGGNAFVDDSPGGIANADPATWLPMPAAEAALAYFQTYEAAYARSDSLKLQGIAWCQGEQEMDAYSGATGPWSVSGHPLFGSSVAARRDWYISGAKWLMDYIRAGLGRTAAQLPWYVFTVASKSGWNADVASAIRTAWDDIAAEPGNPFNVVIVQPNAQGAAKSDSVHLTAEAYEKMDREAARVFAGHLIERDLDDAYGTIGYDAHPRFTEIAAVSGATLDLTLAHGGGDDFTLPTPTSVANVWRVVDASGVRTVTAAARINATTVRVTVSGADLTAPVLCWYAYGSGSSFGTNNTIFDNASTAGTASGFGNNMVDMQVAQTRYSAPLTFGATADYWAKTDGGKWLTESGDGWLLES